jgi:F0F1-type ATP synthase membrane subunit b/b'
MTRFFYFILTFPMIVTPVFAAGGGHGSVSDLIAPTVNVGILFLVLILATKNKIKEFFLNKSKNIADTIERADIKSKEANIMLETQKRKMANLESEIKNIHGQAESEVINFEKNISVETQSKISKLKSDAEMKIQAERKFLVDELNAQLIEQVIAKTKTTIKSNKDYQAKVSNKMLQGLQK